MDKLVCIGKNYLEHARELGDAVPEKPVIFLKPPSILRYARSGEKIEIDYQENAGVLHHECEIVLKIGRGGYCLTLEEAKASIVSVSVGLDMTLRERQSILKKNGHPWEISKVFSGSAVTGPLIAVQNFPTWEQELFRFSLDGKIRQQGDPQTMMLSPAKCISYASEFFPLCDGDLIFTGTPAGVGPVVSGQTAFIEWGEISYSVCWK